MMLMGPWLVLVAAIIVAVVWASQRRDHDRDEVAAQVLDRRLAEGDLTVEEHAQRRRPRPLGHAVRAPQDPPGQ